MPTATQMQWYAAQQQLAALKAQEAKLRDAVIAEAFGSGLMFGTNSLQLDDGCVLKARVGESISFTGTLEDYYEACSLLSKEGVPTEIINRLFVQKINVSVGEYKSLTDYQRLLISKFITIVPSSAQVTLVPPRA